MLIDVFSRARCTQCFYTDIHVPGALVINPRPEGYGSHFVVRSVHRATENSIHFFVPVKV